MRHSLKVVPILALFLVTFGIPAFGQNLFGEQPAGRDDAPLTEEQKAAGERESIF
ncbi:MAG: hypothetical protein HY647_07820 [Acidobacteria bacterium]|nr:hypothetical protein [Acidobacteriota bacterium]